MNKKVLQNIFKLNKNQPLILILLIYTQTLAEVEDSESLYKVDKTYKPKDCNSNLIKTEKAVPIIPAKTEKIK